jgi:hypothetical protein
LSTCKACGHTYRKGTLVTLLVPGQGVTGARVCQDCAAGGMLVVAPKVAPKVEQKVARPEGYEKALRQLQVLARAARGTASQYASEEASDYSHFNGKAEGIESAIEVLKREMGQP